MVRASFNNASLSAVHTLFVSDMMEVLFPLDVLVMYL